MIDTQSRGSGGTAWGRRFRRICLGSTGLALFTGATLPLHASASNSAAVGNAQPADQNPEIIVIAPSLFRDVRPERSLDEDGISSYGVSTVDDLVAEIQAEIGEDEEPIYVVNGERVYDIDDIGAFPVESLRNVQVLPRGSGVRVGGSPGKRVISMTFQRQMRSGTVTFAPRAATAGDWTSTRGETIFTHIRGRSRGNVTFRVRDEGSLLESERGIIQPIANMPFATGGNVIAYPDLSGEIDPLLSDAAGEVVVVAPVPVSADPTLADFVTAANDENFTDRGDFRTLRPALRSYDLNATYTTPLTSWLTSTATLRLGRSASRSLLGPASGIFVLDSASPFSPFSRPVGLAFYGPDPLRSSYRRDSGEANMTMNARLGGSWRAMFNAKHSRSADINRTQRSGADGPIDLAESVDPFGSDLSELLPVSTNRTRSRSHSTTSQLTVTGSPMRLPAGEAVVTAEGRLGWRGMRSTSDSGEQRTFRRSEQGVRGVVEIPLASRRNGFLGEIGELGASAEYSLLNFSDAGGAHRSILGLTWEPHEILRLRGAIERSKEPPALELIGGPTLVTPAVRIFDVLTGETVEVTYVSGGNPDLKPQSIDTNRLSGILRLVPRLGLQLSGEYTDVRNRNFVSSLPPASEPIMLAFPDRFIRDANGVLTSVDVRPVNFADHRQKRLRWGLSLNAPLGGGGSGGAGIAPVAAAADGDDVDRDEPAPTAADAPRPSGPQTRLALTANHTVVLKDEILIRPGLDPVDLLGGGAIGIAGGRVRYQLDATAAVTSGGTGVRMGAVWRGGSVLESRIGGNTGLLRFDPLLTLNLRAFADMRRLFPESGWSRGARVSLNIVNLTNQRQRVRDPLGDTPLQYQPGYRDPLGRTIELELRKVF